MPTNNQRSVSVIIPAKNEEDGLSKLLPRLRAAVPYAEIIVVDDGSTDNTADIARTNQARVLTHPYSMGNGAAIKTGARAATGELLVFLDADGQHDPDDIPKLLLMLETGYDMVVGARRGESQASLGRWYANFTYNWLASLMVGREVLLRVDKTPAKPAEALLQVARAAAPGHQGEQEGERRNQGKQLHKV